MYNDGIEELVEEAHSYFSENSIHEVIDLDRETATRYLYENYGYTETEDIEKYLEVVEKLRLICETDH